MGPAWGPSGADKTQVGPMLVPWTLLSGSVCFGWCDKNRKMYWKKLRNYGISQQWVGLYVCCMQGTTWSSFYLRLFSVQAIFIWLWKCLYVSFRPKPQMGFNGSIMAAAMQITVWVWARQWNNALLCTAFSHWPTPYPELPLWRSSLGMCRGSKRGE